MHAPREPDHSIFEEPPAPPPPEEGDRTAARNARHGLWLFSVYLALYGGFILLAAFRPDLMARRPFGGVNTAVLYGFGLIAAALLLAAVYMYLCRSDRPGGRRTGP
ncbi:MAG: hypothetical protein AMXMBFR83_03000 [Phycisphaerae bacterium]